MTGRVYKARIPLVLDAIDRYHARHSYAISYEELQDELNLSSRSQVFSLVRKMREEGYLLYDTGKKRAITITASGMRTLNEYRQSRLVS